MKVFISLCLILLVTLSNSQYAPTYWTSCHPLGPNTWLPVVLQIIEDPNVKELVTISALGLVENLDDYLDFQTLLVSGNIGADYNWNITSPYVHRSYGWGEYFALNYTTYLPNLDEKNVNVTMRALGTDGNELGCINIRLKNQNAISI